MVWETQERSDSRHTGRLDAVKHQGRPWQGPRPPGDQGRDPGDPPSSEPAAASLPGRRRPGGTCGRARVGTCLGLSAMVGPSVGFGWEPAGLNVRGPGWVAPQARPSVGVGPGSTPNVDTFERTLPERISGSPPRRGTQKAAAPHPSCRDARPSPPLGGRIPCMHIHANSSMWLVTLPGIVWARRGGKDIRAGLAIWLSVGTKRMGKGRVRSGQRLQPRAEGNAGDDPACRVDRGCAAAPAGNRSRMIMANSSPRT